MKTTLTIKESSRLIELGVDAKLASSNYVGRWVHYSTGSFADPDSVEPVFTLTDILLILPKEIDGYHLTIEASEKGYDVGYELWDSFEDRTLFMGSQATTPELIDALNLLIIWCLEQGYCKCGEGGGR